MLQIYWHQEIKKLWIIFVENIKFCKTRLRSLRLNTSFLSVISIHLPYLPFDLSTTFCISSLNLSPCSAPVYHAIHCCIIVYVYPVFTVRYTLHNTSHNLGYCDKRTCLHFWRIIKNNDFLSVFEKQHY